MSPRKHQRRLEEHYGKLLTPWMIGRLTVCTLLMLVAYIGTMPL